jgi:transcriptional regulator
MIIEILKLSSGMGMLGFTEETEGCARSVSQQKEDHGRSEERKEPPWLSTQLSYCFPIGPVLSSYLMPIGAGKEKGEIRQGTLALMILKTLEGMGPLHGYGIARRIEQTSGAALAVQYGTIYPSLVKLEQEGYISSRWDVSANKRKAKYYDLTRAGKKHLNHEARQWEQTVNIVARFFNNPEKDPA